MPFRKMADDKKGIFGVVEKKKKNTKNLNVAIDGKSSG